jgi:DNA-binding NtrC family response regulator
MPRTPKEHSTASGARRVLIIDDDADVRSILQALLENEGFICTVAADGEEGLRVQRSTPASVVVTDIFMPGKEGIETVFELVREFPQTKVIVVSGGAHIAGVDYGRLAVQLGAVKFLKKPFRPQELIDLVRELAG